MHVQPRRLNGARSASDLATRRWRSRLALALVAVALTVAACSGATPAAPAGSVQPAAGGSAVTMKDIAFNPPTLTVPVGTKVTWTNQDTVGHTVTANDGSFSSQTINAGQTFSQTFSTPGTYAYHCTIHPTMTATIIVQ